jgi:hypothetical protein
MAGRFWRISFFDFTAATGGRLDRKIGPLIPDVVLENG